MMETKGVHLKPGAISEPREEAGEGVCRFGNPPGQRTELGVNIPTQSLKSFESSKEGQVHPPLSAELCPRCVPACKVASVVSDSL